MNNKPNIKRKHNNVYREVNWLEKDQEYLNRVKKLQMIFMVLSPRKSHKNRVAKELGLKGFQVMKKRRQ